MSDTSARDKAANHWQHGANRYGVENCYASASESFSAGWDAALEHVRAERPASMYLRSERNERDQLRAEVERLKRKIEGVHCYDFAEHGVRCESFDEQIQRLRAQLTKARAALEHYKDMSAYATNGVGHFVARETLAELGDENE